MSTQDKLLPAVIPFPADISEEIKNGKQEEKLDVNIQTVAVPEEILSDPDMWMPQLLKKIEKAFAPNLGYDNQNKLALSLPLIREIRGDYKSNLTKKMSFVDQVKQMIADNKVMVFSKSYCPFASATKDKLQS